MNDRFKFRAWDKSFGRMIYNIFFFWKENTITMYELHKDASKSYLPNSHIVLEQCTGLKDSAGKEIYEGDIVKTEDGDILVIKWGKNGFNTPELFTSVGFFMSIRRSWGEDHMQFDKEEPYYEVIGNIHENPELLEDK